MGDSCMAKVGDGNINTRQLNFVNHEPETDMEETPLQGILKNVPEPRVP
jgi:hypothetical protein